MDEQTLISSTITNTNHPSNVLINLNKSIKTEDVYNSVTYSDDLSNENIYEIFDFLDFSHIYNAFRNLNTRFQNLLLDSNFPIKINLSNLSKLNFNRIHKEILIPYQYRRKSLSISNLSMHQMIFFIRLYSIKFDSTWKT